MAEATLPPVTPELLLEAYATGYFPMAETQDSHELYWFNPKRRAVLELAPKNHFHCPASLAKALRKTRFTFSFNRDFARVIGACADKRTPNRSESWINDEIRMLYTALHAMGHAHSAEVWDGEALVGGVYGVALGAAFFGESMFSDRTNASKMALVKLVEHLHSRGYHFMDAQFENPHLTQFGFRILRQETYLARLRKAVSVSLSPSSLF